MRVLGIDPGPVYSAYALLDTTSMPLVLDCAHVENAFLVALFETRAFKDTDHLAVERMSPRGAAGGLDTFGTAYWAGIFVGVYAATHGLQRVTATNRTAIVAWATGSSRANKPEVNNAIAELWDETARAIRLPGHPLAGLSASHTWDAAAVALWWLLTRGDQIIAVDGRLTRRDTLTATLVAKRKGS